MILSRQGNKMEKEKTEAEIINQRLKWEAEKLIRIAESSAYTLEQKKAITRGFFLVRYNQEMYFV